MADHSVTRVVPDNVLCGRVPVQTLASAARLADGRTSTPTPTPRVFFTNTASTYHYYFSSIVLWTCI